ncbi:MAG TPA: CHAD domain-containing protein [Vicinamibacterales bacterium]|nr:CHAD domain-containing protein [Vicinamibacterales bacterium]
MEHSALSVALLRQRLVSLLQAMPAAQAGDELSVHQARVASRRLREALPVLSTTANGVALARVQNRVRRITRALGPVRELDVTLSLLAELESKGAAPKRAIARVRSAVAEERQKRRRAMLAEITPSRLDKLRKRLVKVAAPAEQREPSRGALVEAAEQAVLRARRLRAAIDHAGGIYLADRLHRVRIEAKKLRYALEIQRELTRSRSTAHLNRLKRQQDLLGRIHDLEVLIERTREVQASLPAQNRRAMAELNRLIRALEAECRAGHAEYMRGRESLIKLCESIADAQAESRSPAA